MSSTEILHFSGMAACGKSHAAAVCLQDGVRILLGADFITDDDLRTHDAQRCQDPDSSWIAVQHIGQSSDLMLGYPPLHRGKLPSFIDKCCPEVISDQAAEITQKRGFTTADRACDEKTSGLLSDLVPDRFRNSGIGTGYAEVHTADMPERHALALPETCGSADADTAAAPDGDKTFGKIAFVTVDRIGTDSLKGTRDLLGVEGYRRFRQAGQPIGRGQEQLLPLHDYTDGAVCPKSDLVDTGALCIGQTADRLSDGMGQVFKDGFQIFNVLQVPHFLFCSILCAEERKYADNPCLSAHRKSSPKAECFRRTSGSIL